MVHHPAVSDALGGAGKFPFPDAQIVSSPQGCVHSKGMKRPQNRLREMGKIGGMAAAGIIGMFVGATLLALGYQIFMGWVDTNPGGAVAAAENTTPPAS